MHIIVYIVISLFLLFIINLFPYFRQTKKNLMWLVFIFIVISIFMIVDLGLEFIPLAYLLIYVGAVAVMFLFIIVTVDPKLENQKDTFELIVFPAVAINNFLTAILYFLISAPAGNSHIALSINKFFNFLRRAKYFKKKIYPQDEIFNIRYDHTHYSIQSWKFIKHNIYGDNLSFYSILEYRMKDIFVFSEYFYNHHSFLLVIVGFILTVSMIVSIVIAKDFTNSISR